MKEITEILRTEGILSQGFGISPKILYRDKRLTPEAKAIYGYIASFAGNGSTAFPSRDIMLDELGMSKNRYYKHFALLEQCGYIVVTKVRDQFGSFDRNIYTLASNPVALEKKKEQDETEVKPVRREVPAAGSERRQTPKRRSRVFSESRKSETAGEKHLPSEEKKRDWLRDAMAIDEIARQQPEDAKALEKIYMAALDLEGSEQVKIGGSIKNRQQIGAILSSLNGDTTRTVLFKFNKITKNKEYKIRNVKAFLQTLICNSPFEVDDYLEYQNLKQQQEEAVMQQEEENSAQKQREEILAAHPKLRSLESDYTSVMRKLTRIMLTDDAAEKEKLMWKREAIERERQAYLEEHGLPDIV